MNYDYFINLSFQQIMIMKNNYNIKVTIMKNKMTFEVINNLKTFRLGKFGFKTEKKDEWKLKQVSKIIFMLE